METEILHFIGLMRRAGKLETGEEGCRSAVRARKAVLILVAKDASDRAKDRAAQMAQSCRAALLETDAAKDQLAGAVGVSGGSMMAVCDAGFASALLKKMNRETPGQYEELLEAVRKKQSSPQRAKKAENNLNIDPGGSSGRFRQLSGLSPEGDREENAYGNVGEISDS